MRKFPPLNSLRAFEVAARTGSFTAAAAALRVSQSAVSRHVANLEEHLGLQLFQRNGREIKLTQEGAEYAGAIWTAFNQLEDATQTLLRRRQVRPLRISVFPTMGIKWLVPRLGGFHGLHPSIDVQITTSLRTARLDHDEADCTIELRDTPEPGIQYDPLVEIELIPVCSAALLQRAPRLEQPQDLLKHYLLHSMNRPNDWRRWLDAAGATGAALDEGLKFGNSSLAYQAAMEGVGVAMAQRVFVEDDLREGRLVAPFPLSIKTGEVYFLACLKSSIAIRNVAAFRTWLLAAVKSGGRSLVGGP
jgi:LysR family glycine cleavage system transcriptional activator